MINTKIFFLCVFVFSCVFLFSQSKNLVESAAFSDKINSLISYSVPVISVEQAHKMKGVQFLDAREPTEFNVSHLPGARLVGYDHFSEANVKGLDTSKSIIVYCSIGYRSEKIGKKLNKLGFKNVYNLYGSIFEWANRGYELVDNTGKETNKVHVYNKRWGKWMTNPEYEKVY